MSTKKYILLDSAGIRKKGQRTTGVETFATNRTIEAAYQADVICLVLDGSLPISHQDQVVAGIARNARKGIVVLANKADLVSPEQRLKFERQFYKEFAFLKVQEFLWVSAKTGEGLPQIWQSIDNALEQQNKQIDPAELRKLFNYLMKQKPPHKLPTQKKPIVYDLVYTGSNPPTFELLVKNKNTIHPSYLRFLENLLRKQFDFRGAQIVVKLTEVGKKWVLG